MCREVQDCQVCLDSKELQEFQELKGIQEGLESMDNQVFEGHLEIKVIEDSMGLKEKWYVALITLLILFKYAKC